MHRIVIALCTLATLASCTSDPGVDSLVVEGEIEGLKKGTLFLQQVRDSSLITLDSTKIMGDGTFSLQADISDPDLFYLYLEKADNNSMNDRISFFTGPGTLQVRTQWNAFESEAAITGSEAQVKFREFQKVQTRFTVQQLELSQAAMQLGAGDSTALDSLQNLSDRLELRSYLYALNFAMNNKASYLAPYIAVTQVANANPKVLDSIYSALSPEVADSKYGKALKSLIAAGKEEENSSQD